MGAGQGHKLTDSPLCVLQVARVQGSTTTTTTAKPCTGMLYVGDAFARELATSMLTCKGPDLIVTHMGPISAC